MDDILKMLNRERPLFSKDMERLQVDICELIKESSFLIIGGAGSIGQAVTMEIFKRNPAVLHVVDISENNLVELVRTIRSTIGYQTGEFKTFVLDIAGKEYEALVNNNGGYDYVLNLSAMKHVRSEKDPYTLMRMIRTNVLNTLHSYRLANQTGTKKYFCVSTDKAANPVNLMGASKRIMELSLRHEKIDLTFSMARFANVAFSDGSLLHGFNQRFIKKQPLSAPHDVKRYFVTPQESGELCMLSTLFGQNDEIYFPKLNHELKLTKFSDIAEKFLEGMGYEPYLCQSEEEARHKCSALIAKHKWPVHLFASDTTGEKDFEEFYTTQEEVDFDQYDSVGIVKNDNSKCSEGVENFISGISALIARGQWDKTEILNLVYQTLPSLNHQETGKYLDEKM